MTDATKFCPRCGTTGCPSYHWDFSENKDDALDQLNTIADIACSLRKATERQVVKPIDLTAYVGSCPHGYLFCFYCWRDAGFPGAGR